jgi:hypothetical protein
MFDSELGVCIQAQLGKSNAAAREINYISSAEQ